MSLGAMETRLGLFNDVPGLETGKSPRPLGLIAAPSPYSTVVSVGSGNIGLVLMRSETSRIDPLAVADEILRSRLCVSNFSQFSMAPPCLGNGSWCIDAVRYSLGSIVGS